VSLNTGSRQMVQRGGKGNAGLLEKNILRASKPKKTIGELDADIDAYFGRAPQGNVQAIGGQKLLTMHEEAQMNSCVSEAQQGDVSAFGHQELNTMHGEAQMQIAKSEGAVMEKMDMDEEWELLL
jgi:hypothetical protein